MLKPNFGKIGDGANKVIGVAAGIAVGLAITLSAAVHIKRCIKDLLPAKKHKVEIHVFECGGEEEKAKKSEDKTETVELESVKYNKAKSEDNNLSSGEVLTSKSE